MWFLLVACRGPEVTKPPPDPTPGEPTDTYPQFLGRVPKNIVMISMDTFRKDHLDRFADRTGVSPFLSALADEGVVMNDHVQCANWTFPSTSCTLSGRFNEDAGMIPRLSEITAKPWPTGSDFLAGYLHQRGFYSVLASTNGWFSPEWNNTEGYDRAFLSQTGSAWGAYEAARAELDLARHDGRAPDRWFLHVHTVEPHAPYNPPVEYLGEVEALPPAPWDLSNRDVHYEERDVYNAMSPEDQALLEAHLQARYRAEIKHLDDEVFQIFSDLSADGLMDDTLFVFWTDHGEQFWEHGNQTHAYSLYREETDGLLFFWADDIVPSEWTGPTSAIDLVPTMLELYDIPIPAQVTGIPIGRAPEDRARFSNTIARLGPASAVQKNGFKLVFSWYGFVKLFDLTNDPGETTDLYDAYDIRPEARELWAELLPHLEQQALVAPDQIMNLPPELMSE